MNELDFSGKTVLVVGGSSGIGNGIARAFLERGATVHVWGTRRGASDYADSPDSSLAGLHYAQVDVSDAANVERCVLPFASLDVLVQAQGTVLYDRQEFKAPAFRKVLDVNLTSLMACADRCFEALKAARGAMIIVSSAAAFHSTRGNPAYNASKTGAFGLTRTLAEAWARDGIRVNGIAPGLVDTKLTRVTTGDPKRLDMALRRIPLGRLGTPADMAGGALFLASPLSAYMLGQTLLLDGGMLLA
ncbi:SDR family oxidoreductase [Burkholderia multivorans]|uniref:SDR family NAD(P)-dependent oxidoreductase n=1 Tax=Burkholderia multivorans TaxID=87883 RepID=UPI000D0112FC|nr:SDR family oxidoreductase [Burkholderia multivorans]MBU9312563.1 SDR family oxidoreductase [Burkholderia multivorans]MCA8250737.1 SDR family oxidoreductase [Burkholderia multivorans]MCA8457308.1 SDR family oxidoreductase [Burkholderia multivorans]MDN7870410.1 SDR family oxidoreductase [Burkholderia multivorans]PRH32876.1 3-oxoacyl-ACP reductase [Burkholderia multivorans]